MIKLLYQGKNYSIDTVVKKANEILQSNAFYERVAALPQMSNTDLSSREIAAILKENNQEICVKSFWNPFSKSTKILRPCLFKVNSYNLSCTTAFAVNTIINETLLSLALKCNALNFEETKLNESEYENIFPCRIGEVAEILTRKNKMSHLKTQYL
jgi:carboxypeptidase C (cathepsin A)